MNPPDPQNPTTQFPETLPVPSTPVEPISPVTPVSSSTPPVKQNKNMFLVGGLVLILLVTVILGAYFVFLKPKDGNITGSGNKKTIELPRYFANCDDVREVVEEDNKLFIACLGGVVVVNKDSGEVTDQVALPDGLGNSVATSLVKKGEKLFIGTQDGVTVFDLATRQAQKLSVAEGLTNGANLILFDGGDKIWAGTFDGLSLIDVNTLEIKNYKSELDPESEQQQIVNILLGEKYTYLLEVAHAKSGGAVIRFNNADGSIKTFKAADFGDTGPYARLDLNSIARFGSKVFVAQGSSMYYLDEAAEETWKKLESPFEFIKTDAKLDYNPIVNLLPNPDSKGILMYSGNKIYKFVPGSDSTEVLYDFGKYAGLIFKNSGNSIWFKDADPGGFIAKLNLTSLAIEKVAMKGRPVAIGSLLATVNDTNALVGNTDGIYHYDLASDSFEKVIASDKSKLATLDMPNLIAIPGTSKIFIYWQGCGQVCDEPVFVLYDYATKQASFLDVPEDVAKTINRGSDTEPNIASVSLMWTDFDNGQLGLELTNVTIGETPKKIAFNPNENTWKLIDEKPETAKDLYSTDRVICNKSYSYTDNKFEDQECVVTAENDEFKFAIEDGKIKQTNKNDGSVTYLAPETLPAKYSPFDSVSQPSFSAITYASDRLWIMSDRGLISYNPTDASYKVYGPKEGLLSQEVSAVSINKYVWVLGNWGGLSIFNQ